MRLDFRCPRGVELGIQEGHDLFAIDRVTVRHT
jgi:hypothetical protein